MRLTQAEIRDTCFEIVIRDHGDCDQSTCTIHAAIREGLDAVAIENWAGSGASDEEFDRLYSKLGKRFELEVRNQSAMLCDVDHAQCPHCNAVVWHADEVEDAVGVYCDSCARTFKREETES